MLSLCRGVRVGFSFGDVPGQEAPEGDVLDHHAFSEDFRLDRTVSKFVRNLQLVHGRTTDLIHLEQPRVHLVPVLHARRDRVQLRRVLVERPGLDLVYPHDRQEIQVRRWEGRT